MQRHPYTHDGRVELPYTCAPWLRAEHVIPSHDGYVDHDGRTVRFPQLPRSGPGRPHRGGNITMASSSLILVHAPDSACYHEECRSCLRLLSRDPLCVTVVTASQEVTPSSTTHCKHRGSKVKSRAACEEMPQQAAHTQEGTERVGEEEA